MAKDYISEYDTTNANNTVVGDVDIDENNLPSTINNAIREVMTHLKAWKDEFEQGAAVASAAALNVDVPGLSHSVTGTTTITSLANPTNDTSHLKVLSFAGALTLTDSANLILPNGNITTAAGDVAVFIYEGSSVWRLVSYYSPRTDDIMQLTPTDGNFIVGDGSAWVAESGNTARTSLGLGTGDAPSFATGVTIGNLTLANGSITDSGGTIDFGNEHLTTTGNLTVGNLTSKGIDDNATKEMLQIADDLITIGGGDAAESNVIVQAVDDGSFTLSAGDAEASGARLKMYGDTHATQAEDIELYDGATLVLHYDKSATQWDFQDENIVGTGIITLTGTAVPYTIDPGSDADADLLQVSVTGTPKLFWDESEDRFDFTKGIESDAITEAGQRVALTGEQQFFVQASGMFAATTNGATGVSQTEGTAQRPEQIYYDFDPTTDEHVLFPLVFPKSWNAGTITFQAYWTTTGASGDVVWAAQAVALADNDAIDTAYGTAVTVTDTVLAANDLHIAAESGAITIAGTPGDNELTYLDFYRDADAAGDTCTASARLLGVMITYTADVGNDA